MSTRFLSGDGGEAPKERVAGGGAGSGGVSAAVAEMCVRIHTSVEAMAETYYQELRRRWGSVGVQVTEKEARVCEDVGWSISFLHYAYFLLYLAHSHTPPPSAPPSLPSGTT